MMTEDKIESGFLNDPAKEFGVQTGMNDVEILRVTKINIIARGRRYGRMWLLKGLRKELRDSAAYRRQLQKEFEIHSRLHNPAVVQAVGVEDIPGLGTCIVEEWIEGKTLAELLRDGRLDKKERRRILREIIQAVGYLHSMGVIHRDLKPSNIMVRNAGKNVVLIDFGLADTDDYVELKQGAGTPGFISPEQQKEKEANVSDDIYSIGAIMKELTPEYGPIARKCTGNLNRRPKDTNEIIKRLNRRNRRPRLIRISLAVTGILIIGLLALLRILSLSESASEAKSSILEARKVASNAQNAASEAQQKLNLLNETNRKQENQVALLKDSLDNLTIRMTEAQEKLHRVAEDNRFKEKEDAYIEGVRKAEALLAQYSRDIILYSKEYNSADILSSGQDIARKSCNPQRYPNLTATDKEKIKKDIYNHFLNTYEEYQKMWNNRKISNKNK
ncbi:MAG: serine/threonine protein kinase [Muribaculaceae bacterium]|nr:serine/threonine protein kinase [Muribaculaceae bacterium]